MDSEKKVRKEPRRMNLDSHMRALSKRIKIEPRRIDGRERSRVIRRKNMRIGMSDPTNADTILSPR